jgi:hypothetical protein
MGSRIMRGDEHGFRNQVVAGEMRGWFLPNTVDFTTIYSSPSFQPIH